MPCTTCTNNGNTIGCPCQEMPKDNCASTQQFANGQAIYRDNCTGEVKRAVPYLMSQPAQPKFNLVVAKVEPKQTAHCSVVQPCQQRKTCKAEQQEPVCYTCAPKREDAYPADHKCYRLLYADKFTDFKVGQGEDSPWAYFTDVSKWTANDGAHKTIKGKGMLMMANQFTKTYPHHGRGSEEDDEVETAKVNGFLDHYKQMISRDDEFDVPECGEVYVESCMSARTYGTHKHPFGNAVLNHQSDFRLGYAGMLLTDLDSGLVIGFLLTNDSIWALYERIPLDIDDGSEEDTGSAAFAFAHLVGRRNYKNPLKDFARLGLALDNRKGATWYVNGVIKHQIDRLGHLHDPAEALYQLGGETRDIKPKSVVLSYVLGTMLDAIQPSNHRDLLVAGQGLVQLTNARYQHPWDPERDVSFVFNEATPDVTLWGQGASLRAKEVKVEWRA